MSTKPFDLSDTYAHLEHFKQVQDQHPGQANRIYIGELRGQRVAIRYANRHHAAVNEFYDGVANLFGLQLHHPYHYSAMFHTLASNSLLKVPNLITLTPFDCHDICPTHVYVEGTACASYTQLTPQGAARYGRHLAALHGVHATTYGCYGQTNRADGYWLHVSHVIEQLLRRHQYDADTFNAAQKARTLASYMPVPTYFAPVMLDLDPTQYFIQSGVFTHLIDLDFYVFAPPELELVALESMFPPGLAAAFIRGYQSVRPFPDLNDVRPIYRTLNRLICVQGDEPYAVWHDRPILFPSPCHPWEKTLTRLTVTADAL